MERRQARADAKPRSAGGGALRRHAYDSLKSMILSGALRPGERLSETRLSEVIGVSRTPLREALMLLEAEGLVVGRLNSGYSVVHFEPEAIRHLLVAREGIDAWAARLACTTATDDDLTELAAVMDEIDRMDRKARPGGTESERELELGLKIHEVIVAATRNPVLQDITRRLYEQLRAALWLEVLWIDSWRDAVDQHRAIVDAVTARDSDRAERAARAHVQDSIRNMERVERIFADRRERFRLPMQPGRPRRSRQ